MLQSLLILCHQYEQELAELAVANLLGRVNAKVPFAWDDILDFKPSILAYKITTTETQKDGISDEYKYADKGTVLLKKGVLSLSSLSSDDPSRTLLVPAVELLEGQIQILSTKNTKMKNLTKK